jgi:FeS assembly SUF system regulator
MNSKKAITLLVLTTILLSLVPIVPVSADIAITNTYEDDGVTLKDYGHKGQTVAVIGTGVTAGKTVELYWDLVQPWSSSDGAGLLNTSTAEGSGNYEVWFDIPESVIGSDHWLWVRDTETGANDFVRFKVNPYVKASSSSGLDGDKVDLDMYGFGDEEDVAIILGNSATNPTATTIAGAETLGTYAGGGAGPWTYSDTLANDLIKNGTLQISDATLTAIDQGDGNLTVAGLTGTVNYLTGEIELEWTADPGLVTLTTNTYQHFDNVDDTCYVVSTGVETSDFGSVSKTATIPDIDDMDYGDYHFYAFNDKGKADSKAFTIGAVITLDIDEGPVGSVVEIRGSGFTTGEWIGDQTDDVVITGDGVADVQCYIVDLPVTFEEIEGTEFKVEIVIPSVDMDDYDTITVTDDSTLGSPNVASADFEITGEAEIEISPEYGVQGTTISIEGFNFSAIDDEEITLNLYAEGGGGGILVEIDTYDADNDGEFSDTFTVPARTSDTYTIKAEQTDWGIVAEADFRIGMMIVILSPESGPTGKLVTITGTGFTENGEWNATFGDLDLIDDGDVDGTGNLGDPDIPTFYVPTVDPGVYTLTLLDIDTEIEVEVEFTVTDKTMIASDPMQAPQDYNVSLTGSYFAADDDDLSDVTLEWVLWNETDDWEMEVWYTTPGPVWVESIVDDDGNVTAWWKFNAPDATSDGDIELDVGTYWINVTDSKDLFAQFEFNVVEKTVDIEPRKSVFRVGDTLAFNLESSFAQEDSYIKIWDPSGDLYWRTDDFTDVWLSVGTVELVPYYEQVAAMLKLSKMTDYATVILSVVAKDQHRLHGALELAAVTGIALPSVSKILKILTKAGILSSMRGVKGGYVLAREPEKITVATIISALEGPIALTECSVSHKGCDQASGCRIQGNWHLINQKIANALESVTLADMIMPFKQPVEVSIPLSRLYR